MDRSEVRGHVQALRLNRLTTDEYESLISSGRVVRKPQVTDDFAFEQAHPDHPLTATSRHRRIEAADYFCKLAAEAPQEFDLDLLREMHEACADCCPAVRLAIVRTLGCLQNPISLPVLQAVIDRESGETWTRQAATQAIAIINGDWPKIFSAEHNWFAEWLRGRSRVESPNEIETHFQIVDREHSALASQIVAGHKILLEHNTATGFNAVDQHSGESVSLTGEEATQLLNTREQRIGWDLQLAGIPIQPAKDDIRFGTPNFLDEFPNSVLLDSTTLRNAEDCLNGHVTPVNLLDLSVFCTAVICYDRVVVQPFRSEILDEFPAVFSPLDYSPNAISGTLWTICAELFNSHGPNSPDIRELESAWKETFKRDDIALDIPSTDHYQDSPGLWDGIPASQFAERLFSGAGVERNHLNRFLSVQTMRALFNDVLAGLMGVPYVSTSIRAPILVVIMQRKVKLKPIVDAVIEALSSPARGMPDGELSYASAISAPFFLGVVLERSQRPGDILGNLIMYREKAEPLRRQLNKDREAWSGRGNAYLRKVCQSMTRFVATETDLAEKAVNTTVATLSPLVTASQPYVQMASLGVKLTMLLRPLDKMKTLYNRVFKPHIYWLNELSDEAKAVRDVDVQLLRVFGHSWTKEMRSQLELLAATYPAAFAKLRSPE